MDIKIFDNAAEIGNAAAAIIINKIKRMRYDVFFIM